MWLVLDNFKYDTYYGYTRCSVIIVNENEN